jgi:ABC-type uncharacterized transport system auxiliary subunit
LIWAGLVPDGLSSEISDGFAASSAAVFTLTAALAGCLSSAGLVPDALSTVTSDVVGATFAAVFSLLALSSLGTPLLASADIVVTVMVSLLALKKGALFRHKSQLGSLFPAQPLFLALQFVIS